MLPDVLLGCMIQFGIWKSTDSRFLGMWVFYYQKGNQLMDLQHYSMIVQEIIIYVMKFVYFFMQVLE
jgi:hypothetical protein